MLAFHLQSISSARWVHTYGFASVAQSAVTSGPIFIAPAAPAPRPALELPAPPLALVRVRPKPKLDPYYLKSVFGDPNSTAGDAPHAHAGDRALESAHAAAQIQAALTRTPGSAHASAKAASPPSNPQAEIPKATSILPVLASSPPRAPVGTPRPPAPAALATRDPVGPPSRALDPVLPKHTQRPDVLIALANPAALLAAATPNAAHDASNQKSQEAKRATQPPAPKAQGLPATPAPNKTTMLPSPLAPSMPIVLATAQPAPHTSPSPPAAVSQPQSSNTRAGDSGAASDSDSDAFSHVAAIDFRDGRVDAQFGRRIKTVRPKLLLSGQYELIAQDNPRVLLSAKIDRTGKVTNVEIYQSSGSVDLDQPCLVALYDWWFEPPVDKAGHPLPDVVVVAITFHTR